jgi:hypothetical protein
MTLSQSDNETLARQKREQALVLLEEAHMLDGLQNFRVTRRYEFGGISTMFCESHRSRYYVGVCLAAECASAPLSP